MRRGAPCGGLMSKIYWPETIPLGRAYLCADCDHVGMQAAMCIHCGSRAVAHLGKLLDRVPPTPMDAAVTALEFDILDQTMRRR